MMEPDLRYERKFVERGSGIAFVRGLVRVHSAGFRTEHPDRFVNNVYCDTPELQLFWRHLDGTSSRSKLRVRWYGDLFGTVEDVADKTPLNGTNAPRHPAKQATRAARVKEQTPVHFFARHIRTRPTLTVTGALPP